MKYILISFQICNGDTLHIVLLDFYSNSLTAATKENWVHDIDQPGLCAMFLCDTLHNIDYSDDDHVS